jgi:hypothetical protein
MSVVTLTGAEVSEADLLTLQFELSSEYSTQFISPRRKKQKDEGLKKDFDRRFKDLTPSEINFNSILSLDPERTCAVLSISVYIPIDLEISAGEVRRLIIETVSY